MAKILLVDDEPEVRSFLRTILEEAGHATTAVSSGLDALRAHAQDPSDLVILDIFMPEMDGIETLQRLRCLDPDVIVIAISGGGEHVKLDPLGLAMKLGANGALHKPFPPARLLDKISHLFKVPQ